MMSWSACLLRSATDLLGPHQSARPATSYTTGWDTIRAYPGERLREALPMHRHAPAISATEPSIPSVLNFVRYNPDLHL